LSLDLCLDSRRSLARERVIARLEHFRESLKLLLLLSQSELIGFN
jgi:hypothetical protein